MMRNFGRRRTSGGDKSSKDHLNCSGDPNSPSRVQLAIAEEGNEVSRIEFQNLSESSKSLSSQTDKKKRSLFTVCIHGEGGRGNPNDDETSQKSGGKGQSRRDKKSRSRFSLRRLFYGNPLVAQPLYQSPAATPAPSTSKRRLEDGQSMDGKSNVWRDNMSSCSSLQGATAFGSGTSTTKECPLCLTEHSYEFFPLLRNCPHLFCLDCLKTYVRIEIQEGRVNLQCPQCTENLHPNDIESLIGDKNSNLLTLYESLMLRRLLSVDPDTRWCPGPNCTYAVIAAGCASCPRITCERPGCGYSFCYHCKAEWHPNQTCDTARAERHHTVGSSLPVNMRQSGTFSFESSVAAAVNAVGGTGPGSLGVGSQQTSEVKVCPRCNTLIVKMDDGSCNHMTCAVCGTEFCWLCMKEISDLHYLSPSGCTFWGKKPWSRKKKLFWQLGTLVGAPVGIALLAGIAVPAMVIGIPCWVGRKIHNHLRHTTKRKRNVAIVSGVVSSMIVSPLLAGLAVSVGVPILLCYVYGIVPIALCRSEGCGVYTSVAGVKIDVDEKDEYNVPASNGDKNNSVDTVSFRRLQSSGPSEAGAISVTDSSRLVGGRSLITNPSIGEASIGPSLSLGSGATREVDRESASNTAIAGTSIAGSLASGYVGNGTKNDSNAKEKSLGMSIGHHHLQHRLEVGADVHTRKKLSFSTERLSETVSLSERSATISFVDDGAGSAASTRGLAGSIIGVKGGDSQSVSSYRDKVDAIDELSLRSLPLSAGGHIRQQIDNNAPPRSLSPVGSLAGENPSDSRGRPSSSSSRKVPPKRQRSLVDKQQSENSSIAEGYDDITLERVRFDENVSFINTEDTNQMGKGDKVEPTLVTVTSVNTLHDQEGNDHVTLVSVGGSESTTSENRMIVNVSEETKQ